MDNSASLQILTEQIQHASQRMYRLDARLEPGLRIMSSAFEGGEASADVSDYERIYRGIADLPDLPMRIKGFGNLLRPDSARSPEDRNTLYQAMQREQAQRGADDAPWDRVLRFRGDVHRAFTLLSDDLHHQGPSIHRTVAHNILTQWLAQESKLSDVVTVIAEGLQDSMQETIRGYQPSVGDAQDAVLYHLLSSVEHVATTYPLTGPFAWHSPLVATAVCEQFQNVRALRAIHRDVVLTQKELMSTLHRKHLMTFDSLP